jgi:hypothetical protein
MDENRALAFLFLYRCLGVKGGSEMSLSLLYSKYKSILRKQILDPKEVNRMMLGPVQFNRIVKQVVVDLGNGSGDSNSPRMVRASKGYVLRNLYLNEDNMYSNDSILSEVSLRCIQAMGLDKCI